MVTEISHKDMMYAIHSVITKKKILKHINYIIYFLIFIVYGLSIFILLHPVSGIWKTIFYCADLLISSANLMLVAYAVKINRSLYE